MKIPNIDTPLFVTWKKDEKLRGCIGNLKGLNFRGGLQQYAITAAVSDRRFPPIEESEVKDLTVYVSVLTNFEQADHSLDWTVGKHGIIMKAMGYHATFLPEVAAERNWD